jgi:hypothetical protein
MRLQDMGNSGKGKLDLKIMEHYNQLQNIKLLEREKELLAKMGNQTKKNQLS